MHEDRPPAVETEIPVSLRRAVGAKLAPAGNERVAIGDLQTLRELGLPAEHVRLGGDDPACAPRALTTRIKEML